MTPLMRSSTFALRRLSTTERTVAPPAPTSGVSSAFWRYSVSPAGTRSTSTESEATDGAPDTMR